MFLKERFCKFPLNSFETEVFTSPPIRTGQLIDEGLNSPKDRFNLMSLQTGLILTDTRKDNCVIFHFHYIPRL